MPADTSIPENLYALQERIAKTCKQYGRAVDTVKLLAVSKMQSDKKIRIAYESGQRLFGENYVQEALKKQQQLADLSIEWHFIGHIQSNKVKVIAHQFSWVHTIDTVSTAKRLNQYRPSYLPRLNCCIQVNIGYEETKAGILPERVRELADHIIHLPNLNWRGLMIIPPLTNSEDAQRKQFSRAKALLVELKEHYSGIDTLSMGMSGDLDMAIAEGATILRIGTAIFGMRST